MKRLAAACLLAMLLVGCATGPTGSGITSPVASGQSGSAPSSPTPPATVPSSAPIASPAESSAALPSASPIVPPTATSGATAQPLRTPTPTTTPRPSPVRTPAPTPRPLPLVALRYRLVDHVGRPLFCDPDLYPVARDDELDLAKAAYPSIKANGTTYDAITAHLGINPHATPTDSQILAIYREWKMLKALTLNVVAGGYAFDYIAASDSSAAQAWHVRGTISSTGAIDLAQRDASRPPPCPVCLARGTLIATPSGQVPVEDLTPGMAVWSADDAGERILARVLATGSTPVPSTHRVVHLVLADGRSVEASPGHPLPDGRLLGSLRQGDTVDGSTVLAARLVPYSGGRTFDLLPSGPTGTYWANGILLGSTLRNPALR